MSAGAGNGGAGAGAGTGGAWTDEDPGAPDVTHVNPMITALELEKKRITALTPEKRETVELERKKERQLIEGFETHPEATFAAKLHRTTKNGGWIFAKQAFITDTVLESRKMMFVLQGSMTVNPDETLKPDPNLRLKEVNYDSIDHSLGYIARPKYILHSRKPKIPATAIENDHDETPPAPPTGPTADTGLQEITHPHAVSTETKGSADDERSAAKRAGMAPYKAPTSRTLLRRGGDSVQNTKAMKGVLARTPSPAALNLFPTAQQPPETVINVAVPPTTAAPKAVKFERFFTPDQIATNKSACQTLGDALWKTKTRKVTSLSLLLLFLAGLAVMGYYVYRLLNPACREDLALTQQGSNEVSGLLRLFFGTAGRGQGVVATLACAALTAQNFFNRGGEARLNLPGLPDLEGYERAFRADDVFPLDAGFATNLTETREIPCGFRRNGQLSMEFVDKRNHILRASLPLTLIGQAKPSEFSLLYNISLGSNQTFTPFAGLKVQAIYPAYSNRSTLSLSLEQTAFSFSNLDTMKARLESLNSVHFSPRADHWLIEGDSETLMNVMPEFEAQLHGDTATPGTATSTRARLGLVNSCLTTADQLEIQETRVDYTAFERPLSLNALNCSRTLSVSTGSESPYSPYACIDFVSGSKYGYYQGLLTRGLSAAQSYSDAIPATDPLAYHGNFSEISALKRHQEFLLPDELPSGNGLYYRSGVTIIDQHTMNSFMTGTIPLFVSNPPRPYAFSGPTQLTLTPGTPGLIFRDQINTGNRWDLMQLQVTANTLGLSFYPDPNVIAVGNTGIVCIQTMPYCMDILSRAQFSMPIGPSGAVSTAHLTVQQKGLLSGLSSNPRILSLSGCNPIEWPSRDFTRTAGTLNDYDFFPGVTTGFNSTFNPKDGSRVDCAATVRIFDMSANTTWSEASYVGACSGIPSFVNSQAVHIPVDWLPGRTTNFNFTIGTGFNATGCDGSGIPLQYDSRVVTHQVIDSPAEVDVRNGTLFSMVPGQQRFARDLIGVRDQNPAQGNELSWTCSVTEIPDASLSDFAFTFFPGNISSVANATEAERTLSTAYIETPDLGGFNSALVPSAATCVLRYGNSSQTLVFDRLSSVGP